MSEARLHINLAEGIIEAEGDTDFVREVYADFKAQLGRPLEITEEDTLELEEEEEEAPPPPPRKQRPKPKHR